MGVVGVVGVMGVASVVGVARVVAVLSLRSVAEFGLAEVVEEVGLFVEGGEAAVLGVTLGALLFADGAADVHAEPVKLDIGEAGDGTRVMAKLLERDWERDRRTRTQPPRGS